MLRSRRAGFDLAEQWVELTFFVLLVFGLILSISANSVLFNFTIIFVSGLFFGRFLYQERKNLRFKFYLLVLGFLIGYLVGSYYTDKMLVTIMFVVGIIASYYLHYRNIIKF